MRGPVLVMAATSLCAISLAATPRRAAPAPWPAWSLAPQDRCALPPAATAESLLASGRYWHASRTLPVLRGTRPLPPESTLLRALAAEGLSRFTDVEALIRRTRGGDSVVPFLLLAARADERAERWREAERRYRRVLALAAATDEGRAAAPRLAFVLERVGAGDSAIASWRRAAQLYPELADWFAIRRAALESDTAIAFAAVSAARTPGAQQRAQLFVAGRRANAGNLPGALAVYQVYGRPLDVARVEFSLGRTAVARARADTQLLRDPGNPLNPNALLAATFLTERFENLTLDEYIAASRAYRARRDLGAAERLARAAVARGTRLRPDTSVLGWLQLARIQAERRDPWQAMRSLDSASRRAGRPRAGLIAGARVQAFAAADRWDIADTVLTALARLYPGDTTVARAILLFADRHRGKGEVELERGRYRTLLARYPEAPATAAARFRMGLVFYMAGRTDSAFALIEGARQRDSLRALGLGPRYWRERMRLEQGDSTAVPALRALADEYPTWFYGVRAREILRDTTFLSDSMPPLPRPGSFPPARTRERIRLLAALGFDQEARAEAVGWASDTSASVYVLMAAAAAAGEAGLARESIALGEAARARVGMVPGVARALFPFSYRAVIEAEANELCVDPLLLASLIRQESRFDPRALSPVGARGMSQVMPATGQQLAERYRLGPWDANLLFTPDFNLHLGARYVSDRMGRDSFPVYALLASYNAGPARVTRWKTWPEYDDTDLFSERVAITETRDYVRTVYASYVWYRYAWASPPPAERQPAPVP